MRDACAMTQDAGTQGCARRTQERKAVRRKQSSQTQCKHGYEWRREERREGRAEDRENDDKRKQGKE